jgi:hypothetical protein
VCSFSKEGEQEEGEHEDLAYAALPLAIGEVGEEHSFASSMRDGDFSSNTKTRGGRNYRQNRDQQRSLSAKEKDTLPPALIKHTR